MTVSRLRRAVVKRLRFVGKGLYQTFVLKTDSQRTVVFIFGCQRSGTTLMTEIFDKDVNARVYGEFSKLSSRITRRGIRLKPLIDVEREIGRQKFPLIVLKPLVETQNAQKLLGHFEGSRALWMYRNFADVISSDLTEFGRDNGIDNIRPIYESKTDNWRSEWVPKDVRDIVSKYFSENMNPYDAGALFWFVRNRLFFDLKLSECPNVMLCKYEDLVTDPMSNMRAIYDFIGCDFPRYGLVNRVTAASIGKGKSVELSSEVRALCDCLLDKLDRAHRSQLLRHRAAAPLQEHREI